MIIIHTMDGKRKYRWLSVGGLTRRAEGAEDQHLVALETGPSWIAGHIPVKSTNFGYAVVRGAWGDPRLGWRIRGRAFSRSFPELRLTGLAGCPEDLRGAARGRHGGVVRPERAARRGRMGPLHPAADQELRAIYPDHLKEHARSRRRVFPPRVETRYRSLAFDGSRQALPAAGRG